MGNPIRAWVRWSISSGNAGSADTHSHRQLKPTRSLYKIYIHRKIHKKFNKIDIGLWFFFFFLWIETMINLSIHHFRIDLLFIGIDDIDMKIRSNNNKLISHFEMLAPDSLTLSRAYDILIAISINMYSVWFETINTCNDGSIFGASNFSRCFSFMALECRQKKNQYKKRCWVFQASHLLLLRVNWNKWIP